jgi:hypothetical protein
MVEPKGRVATTLGQFGYELDSEGNVRIKDQYDFDKGTIGDLYTDEGRNPALKALVGVLSGGFGPAVGEGQRSLPPGTGRNVNVTIPKSMFGNDYGSIVDALNRRK